MNHDIDKRIRSAYAAFNSRDIDAALATFHPDVEWPKAFEGGYVHGHDEIRKYWRCQWTEIDPHVDPESIREKPDATYEVTVRQFVKDLKGNVLFDGIVRHVYTIQDGLLRKMEIEN